MAPTKRPPTNPKTPAALQAKPAKVIKSAAASKKPPLNMTRVTRSSAALEKPPAVQAKSTNTAKLRRTSVRGTSPKRRSARLLAKNYEPVRTRSMSGKIKESEAAVKRRPGSMANKKRGSLMSRKATVPKVKLAKATKPKGATANLSTKGMSTQQLTEKLSDKQKEYRAAMDGIAATILPKQRPTVGAKKATRAKVTRSKNSDAVPPTKRRSTRLYAKNYKPVLLDNGLLDMEKTPEHLVKVVKRNATDSPLLRLPGEIRNNIWVFALSDIDIEVLDYTDDDGNPVIYGKAIQQQDNYDNTTPLSAFHLPQVCRQIYAETATLAYALSTLIFSCHMCIEDDCVERMKEWRARCIPAFGNSIRSLEPSGHIMEEYCSGMNNYRFKDIFPALKYIYVSEQALDLTMKFGTRSRGQRLLPEEWEAWIEEGICEREGEGVEVMFRGD